MRFKTFIIHETAVFREKILLVPFFPIFLSVTIGVLIGIQTQHLNIPFYACLVAPIILIISLLLKRKLTYTLLLLLGASLVYLQEETEVIPENRYVKTEICIVDSISKGKYLIDVEKIEGKEISTQRLLLIYGNKNYPLIKSGDLMQASLMFEHLRSSSIRGKGVLEDIGITTYAHAQTVSTPKIIGQRAIQPNILWETKSFFVDTSYKLATRLDSLQISKPNRAIIKAMTLGIKRRIPMETRDKYSNAGISHILAISGLHIGIICMLLNLLFWYIPNYKKHLLAKQITITLLLIFFALMVGATPSICRATFMFCFLQYSFAYRKSKYKTYNILFASALFLLLMDYKVLSDIGFQLSYSAVFAIIFLYERFSAALAIKQKLIRIFIDIALITIVVQLFTSPIVFYYFGNFSFVSVFANIATTFLLPFIIIATLSYLAIPNTLSETIIQWTTSGLEKMVNFLTSLPASSISGIYFTTTDIVTYFVCLLAISIYLAYFYKME